MGLIGGGGGGSFTFGMLILVLGASILMPFFILVWCPPDTGDLQWADEIDDLNNSFKNMTGSQPASEAVWGLTGIYTPYSSGAYGTTEDGWIFGESINSYSPAQYKSDYDGYNFTVGRTSESPLFKYTEVGRNYLSLNVGDYYTDVVFDSNQKSKLFFVESQKNTIGSNFYYNYTGYRYVFQPMAKIMAQDINENSMEVAERTSSLSLIWYDYYNQEGISGQLIISGSDTGVAYITADMIIESFIQATSAAKFNMMFNGVNMNIYIKMDPAKLAEGLSIAQCFKMGYWTIMVTSPTTSPDGYITPEFALNPMAIFDTLVDMLSFDMSDYGASDGSIPMIVSIFYTIILYAFLVALCVENIFFIVLPILVGVIQTLSITKII